MKIVLVAPSGVPFAVGGAEKLWWGLQQAVHQQTPHTLELIKLPSPERDFWEVLDAYRRFSELDLGHFDLLISTKYPAWMVSHPNHTVYLQHTLRGLYDTWPAQMVTRLPDLPRPPALAALLSLTQQPHPTRDILPEFFARIAELRTQDLDARWTAFPGSLIRHLVHVLDRIALAPTEINRYCAISSNVTGRDGYFPPGVSVDVIHHPSDLFGLNDIQSLPAKRPSSPVRFFTISRLDGAKRLDLLIRAFRRTSFAGELRIAGTGPAEAALCAAAEGDSRIHFLGRVHDREVLSEYAAADIVPFIPYDEDLGLITLEAMQAGRPVLTCSDSGGSLEFVTEGVTGCIAEPNEQSLAQTMERMVRDLAACARMGDNARVRAQRVSWAQVVEALLPRKKRPRWLVANLFSPWVPDSGGKKRVYHLYSELSEFADITLLTFAATDSVALERRYRPGFRELTVPRTRAFDQAASELATNLGISADDLAVLLYPETLAETQSIWAPLLEEVDGVIFSHPYLYPLMVDALGTLPCWYDAHNIETDLKAAMLRPGVRSEQVLSRLAQVEGSLCQRSKAVIAVSETEQDAFRNRFGAHHILVAENGFAAPLRSPERRARIRNNLGLSGIVAVFVGSAHQPNVLAAQVVLDAFAQLPPHLPVQLWVIGSVCSQLMQAHLSENVALLGVLSQPELECVFDAADLGINPMLTGAGTNLKTIDYAGHDLLLLSSAMGVRGLLMEPGRHYLNIEGVQDLVDCLTAIVPALYEGGAGAQQLQQIRNQGRAHAEHHYTWHAIARRLFDAI